MTRLVNFFKDLFYGLGNRHADLGRILAGLAMASMLGGQIWNIHLGQPIDLGPNGLGGGLTGVLGAVAALIFFKDRAHTNDRSTPSA